MCWDTDGELLVIDLEEDGTENHILGRNAVIPRNLRPFLSFDEVTEEEVMSAQARAFQLIEMRGGAVPTAASRGGEDSNWYFSDPALSAFSQP